MIASQRFGELRRFPLHGLGRNAARSSSRRSARARRSISRRVPPARGPPLFAAPRLFTGAREASLLRARGSELFFLAPRLERAELVERERERPFVPVPSAHSRHDHLNPARFDTSAPHGSLGRGKLAKPGGGHLSLRGVIFRLAAGREPDRRYSATGSDCARAVARLRLLAATKPEGPSWKSANSKLSKSSGLTTWRSTRRKARVAFTSWARACGLACLAAGLVTRKKRFFVVAPIVGYVAAAWAGQFPGGEEHLQRRSNTALVAEGGLRHVEEDRSTGRWMPRSSGVIGGGSWPRGADLERRDAGTGEREPVDQLTGRSLARGRAVWKTVKSLPGTQRTGGGGGGDLDVMDAVAWRERPAMPSWRERSPCGRPSSPSHPENGGGGGGISLRWARSRCALPSQVERDLRAARRTANGGDHAAPSAVAALRVLQHERSGRLDELARWLDRMQLAAQVGRDEMHEEAPLSTERLDGHEDERAPEAFGQRRADFCSPRRAAPGRTRLLSGAGNDGGVAGTAGDRRLGGEKSRPLGVLATGDVERRVVDGYWRAPPRAVA